MELFLQMGHGMQALAQELIKYWGKGTCIISPVNMKQDKLEGYSNRIHSLGGEVLFDPQMFYPKEGHIKLQEYDYWPQEGVSVTSEHGKKSINREILRINNLINSTQVILPGIEMKEDQVKYNLDWISATTDYFREKTNKPLSATLCLYPETIRNSSFIEVLEFYQLANTCSYLQNHILYFHIFVFRRFFCIWYIL